MRISEIITESSGKPRKSVTQASPGAISFNDLNPNANPYKAYRFGVAMAGSPDFEKDMGVEAAIGPEMTMTTYTAADADIVKAAGKKMGSKAKIVAGPGSEEVRSIQTVSPVAKPKPNKYGV